MGFFPENWKPVCFEIQVDLNLLRASSSHGTFP